MLGSVKGYPTFVLSHSNMPSPAMSFSVQPERNEKFYRYTDVDPSKLEAAEDDSVKDQIGGEIGEIEASNTRLGSLGRRIRDLGIDIEERGIEPVPVDQRTDTSSAGFYDGFSIWASANLT